MADNLDQYPHVNELLAGDLTITSFRSPGPVSDAYLNSSALIRALVGPYGSGKTTTCLMDQVFHCIAAPRGLDGVRRWYALCLRDTYRELYKTVIKSWHDWFPPEVGEWAGGQDRPAMHKIRFRDDFGPAEFTAEFAAIPDTGIEKWLDGFQASSIFINSMPSAHPDVLTYAPGRVKRYPPRRLYRNEAEFLAHDFHVAGDANKTDVDHWFYKRFFELPDTAEYLERARAANIDPAKFQALYDMPGGLDPAAENTANLAKTYYTDLLLNEEWWVNIYVHNQWGPSRNGEAVYTRFREKRHKAARDFEADPNYELMVGLDAGTSTGGRPSAVFFQDVRGQIRVIDELFADRQGPTAFANLLAAKMAEPHLRNHAGVRAWCDPSAFYGHDESSREDLAHTWLAVVEAKTGLSIECPESNELEGFRLETVRQLLKEPLAEPGMMGSEFAFLISPRCRLLIGGFNSGYKYKLIKNDPLGGKTPAKNKYSHPHDALQHGVTGYFGRALVTRAEASRSRQGEEEDGYLPADDVMAADFDIFNL